ncbi:MAG: twin-arginine translocase TatA/TatE family subunit [Acidobacteriota bacterium]
MGGIGVPELLVVLGILVLLFGATKLPQIGRGLGEGIRNFKTGVREPESDKIDDGESVKPR